MALHGTADPGLATYLEGGGEMARALGITVFRSEVIPLGEVILTQPGGQLTGIVIGDARRFHRPAPRRPGMAVDAAARWHADHEERVRREVLLDVRQAVRAGLRRQTPFPLLKRHEQAADLERLLSGVDSPAVAPRSAPWRR